MTDIVKTEEIVRIANDTIAVDTGTDWIAVIALVFSVLSTIGILWWQNYLRKKDKEEQRLLREKDRQEQLERTKKDDAARKWNALYPYRIKFYTEFYDVLYRFVYYNGSDRERLCNSGTQQRTDIRIRPIDIIEFCNKFNKFTEEAKVLFDKHIHQKVKQIYIQVEKFVKEPLKQEGKSLIEYTGIIEGNGRDSKVYQFIEEGLRDLQHAVYDEKLNAVLRNEFNKYLQYTDGKQINE